MCSFFQTDLISTQVSWAHLCVMSSREDAPAVKLKFTVSPSLRKQLEKLVESRRTQSEEKVEMEVDG